MFGAVSAGALVNTGGGHLANAVDVREYTSNSLIFHEAASNWESIFSWKLHEKSLVLPIAAFRPPAVVHCENAASVLR